MVKILLTGATGYVGGQALYSLYHANGSRLQITALVRDAIKAAELAKHYPEVRILRGDLDDVDLVRVASQHADAVFHLASTKHAASSAAIAHGLESAVRKKPGYWIQMSGASMFSGADIRDGSYGEARPDIYHDIRDANAIRSMIQGSPGRIVDQLVLAQDPSKVRTALVVGPLIYGQGQGPGSQRSIQIPEIAKTTLQTGAGFRVGAGKSAWSNVHIHDLGTFFRAIVEAIVADRSDCWNDNGIYIVENGSLSFGEIGAQVAAEAHKQRLIASPDVSKTMTVDEANVAMPHGAVLWATNAVGIAERAKSRLGWDPIHGGPESTIEETVRLERRALGKL